jgi:Helicase conserved C-terminal domain
MSTSSTSAPAPAGQATAVRSLADALRAADDERLAGLLQLRPDLTQPVPADMTELVARATSATSVARALDELDRNQLWVVDALAVLPSPSTSSAVAAVLPLGEARVEEIIEDLESRGLVWRETPGEITLIRTVREVLGPYPAGLGPAARKRLTKKYLQSTLASMPDDARAVLDQLSEGQPVGAITDANRSVTRDTARSPVEWLLAHDLLQPLDDNRVVVPLEVGLALRGGLVHEDDAALRPITPLGTGKHPRDPDKQAGLHAHTFVAHVEALLELWSFDAPPQLRSGGVGVRDIKRTADTLDLSRTDVVLIAETAYAAGLLADDGQPSPSWLPTPAFDAWIAMDVAQRWASLVDAWLTAPRAMSAIETARETKDDERIAPLSPAAENALAATIRRNTLDALVANDDALLDAQDVERMLAWRRPRRWSQRHINLVWSTMYEAATIGLTGGGVMGTAGRLLLEGAPLDRVAAALGSHLPAPIDHVLIQADLTAVAPGPLESSLAREMSLVADLESRGTASVYRITDTSVRRALDAGRTPQDIVEFLTRTSRTPLPQPLTYLVEDVARHHGTVRVGSSSTYVRCDDEAALAAVLTNRALAPLQLRRIAPTVLISPAAPDVVLERLRGIGAGPMAEGSNGTLVVRRPDSRRTPPRRRPQQVVSYNERPSERLVEAAVRAMRAADRVASRTNSGAYASAPRVQPMPIAQTLDLLGRAVTEQSSVWISYTDNHGSTTHRIIDPLKVTRGVLSAYDHRTDRVTTFTVSHVVGVAPIKPQEAS